MGPIFKVSIPHTRNIHFDYHSDDLNPGIGTRVLVPFRQQNRIGIVIAKEDRKNTSIKTKAILKLIDETPLLSADMLALCQWVSNYYQTPLSEVLALALPKKYRNGEPCQLPRAIFYALRTNADDAHLLVAKIAKKQHALIDFLAQHTSPVAKKALTAAGFKKPIIQALLKAQIIQQHEQIAIPTHTSKKVDVIPNLNVEQLNAVNCVRANLEQYQCFLLQGVTGSGKTEVYLQVITTVLALHKQVLILVPEIGLTPQLLARFSARFKEPMAIIHSNLNDRERQEAWQLAANQQVRLIIGTRSAIFTPMPSLGLIVIDEEHDASFKQMDGVRYSARDTALMRAFSANIPIVLGSATPSLESLHNCTLNKYQQLTLRKKAIANNPLRFQITDLRCQILKHGLAQKTLDAIATHLHHHNQVLVFINRRGFAPVLLCHQCGAMEDCRACDGHLTFHRKDNKLVCHHCGYSKLKPSRCHRCKNPELLPIGTGTQQIHEFLNAQFPQTNILRVDRDEVRHKHALSDSLAKIDSGEAQLVVGTQMMAKGHHFPHLTLVVILDADNGFYNQDFRALEHLGQLLVQVSGRAGRAHRAGEVIIQTHIPDHPMLNLLVQKGYTPFAKALLDERQKTHMPPFHFIALIRAQGREMASVLQFLHQIKEHLLQSNIDVLGPAPAPLARKANHHRLQLLLKSGSRLHLQRTLTELREWITINRINQSIRWNIDVDPMDLT